MDVIGVAAQLGDLLVAGDVDEADGVVSATGREPRAVGAEGQAIDRIAHVEAVQLLTRPDVQQAQRVVSLGAHGQQLAIGSEGETVGPLGVSRQAAADFPRGRVPEQDLAAAPGGDEKAPSGLKRASSGSERSGASGASGASQRSSLMGRCATVS